MSDKSIESIMNKFDNICEIDKRGAVTDRPFTILLPKGYKEKYDQIQLKSEKRLSPLLRELIVAAIDRAEAAI